MFWEKLVGLRWNLVEVRAHTAIAIKICSFYLLENRHVCGTSELYIASIVPETRPCLRHANCLIMPQILCKGCCQTMYTIHIPNNKSIKNPNCILWQSVLSSFAAMPYSSHQNMNFLFPPKRQIYLYRASYHQYRERNTPLYTYKGDVQHYKSGKPNVMTLYNTNRPRKWALQENCTHRELNPVLYQGMWTPVLRFIAPEKTLKRPPCGSVGTGRCGITLCSNSVASMAVLPL